MLGSEGFIVPLIWTRRSSSKKEANINNIQAAAASEVKKMAATSSSVPFYGIREEEQYNAQPQAPLPPSQQQQATAAPPKKKRNLPGNPNPDAEVIALSPKTLLATNRFICEVCNKGFQREQNLQLHRRGHNLPWKLKQKNPKEVRRRVYICPEPTCVHHEPSRALGDLTGIKKHFCRKHGEKKWKCDKCSKKYAVQSDWKAHSKTCGTREYRCDCGTLFSRRDSFITHRAFCDALAQESARLPSAIGGHGYGSSSINLTIPPPINPPLSAELLRLGGGGGSSCAAQFGNLTTATAFRQSHHPPPFYLPDSTSHDFGNELLQTKHFHGLIQEMQTNANESAAAAAGSPSAAGNLFNLSFFSNNLLLSDQFNSAPTNANLMSNLLTIESAAAAPPPPPQMSATALLQKAAQMGATSSGANCSSLLAGFGSKHSENNTRSTQAGNENHFQSLMSSLANGNSGLFSNAGAITESQTGLGGVNSGLCGDMDESKSNQNSLRIGSGSDGLTRDFLGVAMATNLDPELKSAPLGLWFGDGNVHSVRGNP